MNFAIGTLIVITLLLPGILFRTFIIKSESFENPLDTSINTEIGFILVYSIIAHTIGFVILSYLIELNFRMDQLIFLINGNNEKIDFLIIENSIIISFIYLFCQIILSITVAIIIKKLSLKYFWDLKWNYLPITSEWDNILSGRLNSFERYKEIKGTITNLENLVKYVKSKKN